MKRVVVAAVALALMGVVGCGGGDSAQSADDQAISRTAQLYAQSVEDQDFGATCALLTPDSLQRIKDLKVFGTCEKMMKTGLGQLSPEEARKLGELSDIQVDGDTASAQSRGETIDFKKIDGEWKLSVEGADE